MVFLTKERRIVYNGNVDMYGLPVGTTAIGRDGSLPNHRNVMVDKDESNLSLEPQCYTDPIGHLGARPVCSRPCVLPEARGGDVVFPASVAVVNS